MVWRPLHCVQASQMSSILIVEQSGLSRSLRLNNTWRIELKSAVQGAQMPTWAACKKTGLPIMS